MSLGLRAALFAGAVAVAAALLRLAAAPRIPLQTNILAMLPPTERDPVAEKAVAKLGLDLGRRAVFLVSHAEEEKARAAAARFAKELRAAGGFRAVIDELPPPDLRLPASLY